MLSGRRQKDQRLEAADLCVLDEASDEALADAEALTRWIDGDGANQGIVPVALDGGASGDRAVVFRDDEAVEVLMCAGKRKIERGQQTLDRGPVIRVSRSD